ncbi:thermonuclease family protein [Elstera litoralis]|uniref:thermonuclease family protein n=1 Tax=Elstera litoralis TaxID=552518 RepID=UPI0018DE8B78|nr:thermonuclease family protein [Elstera litoralis]
MNMSPPPDPILSRLARLRGGRRQPAPRGKTPAPPSRGGLRLPRPSFLSALALLAVLIAGWFGYDDSAPCPTDAKLTGPACAVDGDTLHLGGHLTGRRCSGGELVRLWGINAPESGTPGHRKSQDALQSLVAGRTIACSAVDRDDHSRTVARCCAAGQDLSLSQAAGGWAWDYAKYSKGAYAGAEAAARKEGRGIWGAGE